MNKLFPYLLAASVGVMCVDMARPQDHRMAYAADLKWQPVPSLPKGAQMAVIEGPMNEAVPFTVRLKFPANYRIPAHWHPAVERVTVLAGEFWMGVGDKLDEGKSHALKTGDVMLLQPRTPHFAWTKVATEVQLHGTGPWGITYLNADDDPRKQ
jgi:quercetin dioxygenase-like cupin family protein